MKLCLCLCWAVLGAGVWLQQTAILSPQNQAFSTGQFRLLTRPRRFALRFVSNGRTEQAAIPRDWLIPPQEEKEEEEAAYVSSFSYDTEVQSFPIGNGQIGLHLSSYDIEREGTGHAAAGRDVFLIFDPKSLLVTRGGIERGVTKWRVRSEGCLGAASEHYVLADIDQDARVDIGVVTEEIQCVEKYNKDEDKEWMEPTYKQSPALWYVFRDSVWKLEPKYSGKIPESVAELPLIGTAASDVNDLPLGLWRKFDPSRWLAPNQNPPTYVPVYWKNKAQKPAAP